MVYSSLENWEKEEGGRTAEDYLREHPVGYQNGVNVVSPASTKSDGRASPKVFNRIDGILTQIEVNIQKLQENLLHN